MAIQGVSFMGSIKPAAEKIANETKIYMGKEPIGNIEKQVKKAGEKLGDLRATDLKAFENSHGNINIIKEAPTGDKVAEAWKAAHGIF